MAILTIIQVLFNSPARRQPKLEDCGLLCGLDTEEAIVNSSILPYPLGSTIKDALVQIFTAVAQSPAVTWADTSGRNIENKNKAIRE